MLSGLLIGAASGAGTESELAAEAEPAEQRIGDSSALAIRGRDAAETIVLVFLSLAFCVSFLVSAPVDAAFTWGTAVKAGLALIFPFKFIQ